MNQYGFARDCTFKLIKGDKNSLTYSLIANEETKTRFPYNFQLIGKKAPKIFEAFLPFLLN